LFLLSFRSVGVFWEGFTYYYFNDDHEICIYENATPFAVCREPHAPLYCSVPSFQLLDWRSRKLQFMHFFTIEIILQMTPPPPTSSRLPPAIDHRCQASKRSVAKLPLPLLKLRPKPVIATLSFKSLTISREAGKHQKRPNSPNGGHSRPFDRPSLSASRESPPTQRTSPNSITIAASHTQSSSDSLSRKSKQCQRSEAERPRHAACFA
jgi:hypothetical protein